MNKKIKHYFWLIILFISTYLICFGIKEAIRTKDIEPEWEKYTLINKFERNYQVLNKSGNNSYVESKTEKVFHIKWEESGMDDEIVVSIPVYYKFKPEQHLMQPGCGCGCSIPLKDQSGVYVMLVLFMGILWVTAFYEIKEIPYNNDSEFRIF